MTIHEAMISRGSLPLLSVLFLLMMAQMSLLFVAFRVGRSRRVWVESLLHFLVSFVLLYLLMLDTCFPEGSAVSYAVLSAFGSLPAPVPVLYEVFTALILLAEFRRLFRYRREHPTIESIKETMDLLPAGITFGKEDGTVIFSNLAMNFLSRALTGKELTDLSAFLSAAKVTGPETQLTLEGGSGVWQLTKDTLKADGEPYTQLIATDITQQARVTRELEDMNEKLRDLHMRLDIYNKQAERIIIAQELLTARMAVHSEVGNVLLESRQYLNDPASFDEEKLLQALKYTNTYLLREYEEDDTARDPLSEAVETAQIIGVDVLISGPLPADDPYRSLLAAAIGECASNIVKHADGDQLTVEIRQTDKEMTFILYGNGEAPKNPVRESGGLLSLRSLVEKEGGTMQTEATPSFTLSIRIPKTN